MKKLKAFWKNKWKILAGIWNDFFPSNYIKRVSEKRAKICESNICGYYDKEGKSEECFVQHRACCTACGCKLAWKQKSLSSTCGLIEINKKPLWEAVMSESDESKFRLKSKIHND